MKLALIEIPYDTRLAIPLDQLGAFQHSMLVTGDGYGGEQKFTVASPDKRLDVKVYDDSEIAEFAPPTPANEPAAALPPTPPVRSDDDTPF